MGTGVGTTVGVKVGSAAVGDKAVIFLGRMAMMVAKSSRVNMTCPSFQQHRYDLFCQFLVVSFLPPRRE